MSKAVANLTQSTETITFSAQDNGETISVNITEAARGAAGAAGPAGPNEVTSATTSDGTANLSLSNVTTATATVTGTLTADHIHGNLAGSVYAHVRAGETLAKGDPVYISGSHGSGSTMIAIVSKADASDPLKMPAVGVMDAAVTANANGHMVITGTISDINTATYSVNAELYVAEGGGFTATAPLTYAQPVARVERSNTNNGAIIVKVNGLSAISPTASTLVRRDSSGVSDFNTINLGDLHTGGSPVAPYGSIGKSVLTGSSGVGISGNPDVALEAATHRLTLSSTGIALTSGTITTSQPLSLTQTWNAAGVTFKGIDVNVTDTASNAASTLMDLRVGGVSKATILKTGTPNFVSDIINWGSSGQVRFFTNTSLYISFELNNGNSIPFGYRDVLLNRDAANTLAQRNGTNAQESRVYGTYTSATNFERLNLKYNGTATAFQIGTEKGSAGGTARPLEFQTDGTTRMTIGADGTSIISSHLTTTDGSSGANAGFVFRSGSYYHRLCATDGFTLSLFTEGSTPTATNVKTFEARAAVGFALYTNTPVVWGAGSANNSSKDTGVGRESAGVVAITNGTASNYRDLKLRNLTASSDIEATDSTKGVILKSPDGTRYRITVANGGTLTVTAVV